MSRRASLLWVVILAACILGVAVLFIVHPWQRVRPFVPTASGYIRAAAFAATERMDPYWDEKAGYYTSPVATSSLTNIMMVQALSILAHQDALKAPDVRRARALLQRLVNPPVTDAIDGVSFYMDRYADPHISVSGPFCTALFYAWQSADALGLTTQERLDLESRVLQEMRWVQGQLFANRTGSNQTALRWGLEAASSAFRMTGRPECREFADECLSAFAKYYRETPDSLYARPWINPDWTWIYDPTFPHQAGPTATPEGVMKSRAEYGFEYLSHCAAGVYFYQQMGDNFPEEYIPAANALLRRSLGEWVVAGYPNWITTQRDHRAFSTNYWIWSLYGLIAMSSWESWDAERRQVSRAILDNGVALFYDILARGTRSEIAEHLANPYGVKLYESASLNRHPDLAIAMYAAYVAMAVDVNVFAVSPAPDPRVWGWESEARNLFASTRSYGLASGNDVLTAYYEDRGDITLLYHGNGMLVSPAYAQQADPPPQWSVRVATMSGAGGPERNVTYSDQTKPDAVVVLVDGKELAPPDYDVMPHDVGFDRIAKRSTWTRPEYRMELTLTCLPSYILREVVVTPTGAVSLTCVSYFPNRQDLIGIDCVLRSGKVLPIGEAERKDIPLTDISYFHCKYKGYGYVVIQAVVTPTPGFSGSIRVFSPGRWDWDTERGPCVALTLGYGQRTTTPIRLFQTIGFTNGTREGAAEQYTALMQQGG